MKKSLLALAALGTFAGAAHAQSSVTLYGIIDAGFLYSNNSAGQKLYALNSGNVQGSRWGLRGTEDLGGGLKALFVLENGFNVFNGALGQGGDEFGRQAYVGLSTAQYGTVTLGRQYDSVVDFTGAFEVGSQWATYFGAHPGDLDNMNNSLRVNNSVKFTSANYAGFTFGGLYSLGGNAGQFNRNQIWSAGLGYSQGPLQLGAAYLNVKDPNYSFFGNNTTSRTAATAGTASNFPNSRVISGFASAHTQQVISAGGAYTFGAATVGATYSNTQFKDVGREAGAGLNPAAYTGGSGKFHNAELNFKYQLTPALLLGVAYDYTKGYGLADAKYHQGMLGADYFLSKRTDVYIDGVYQHATGTDSTQRAAVASINGLSPSSTSNQVAALVGIRHKF
ncbi:porin [Caballeronia sp. LP006]|uniref:porin n=1 Tax=unclassified Caballeronia TaxID=2646786 RepID=UPI001FD2C886|nr:MULTISPECIES: porin [unclassified Caballeronia]MDR5772599.1 porin [Caballeronia sp. LZ002]MDR5803969.1 porin [Caballeronia sp. LZ001]MDR5832197.1 porin [Caballeronia sp. LP006]MDR5848033.1 porin [Caballeronia sp. LZ003]